MRKKIKVIISLVILIMLMSGLYFFTDWFSKVTGYVTGYVLGEDEKVKLAQCLDGKGTEYYKNLGCADCEKQEKLFGMAFNFISFKDCSEDACGDLREFPAWYIDKKVYYGYKNLSELSRISGCGQL